MPTDYDAPRVKETDDIAEESLDELATRRRTDADAAVLDVDDGDAADSFELPRRPVRGGAHGAGGAEAGRRVHLLELLFGAAPQPPGAAQG